MGNLNETRVTGCARYGFQKQIFACQTGLRIWAVAVAGVVLCVSSAAGQSYSPSQQSSDCSDPSANCQSQSQTQGQNLRVPSTDSQQLHSTQTPDSASRDVYV